jgi:hypothetical protein
VHHAEAGDTIAGVLDEPQQREHVLDVCGVKKLETAELHERDVATGKLYLQRSAVRGRPEKDRLLFEESTFLAGFENALDDLTRLIGLVSHGDQSRLCR